VRIWVRGVLPGNDKVFNLDPKCGYGDKVKIEIYTDSRYFTVTGDSIFEDIIDVEERDLTKAYQVFHFIKTKYPAPKSAKSATADAGEATQVEWLGTFRSSKFQIFANGRVESQTPFIISDGIGRLRYESQSEADLAFATVAAVEFDGDADKIDDAMRASNMMRPKWERKDYREKTIAKAIESAERIKAKSKTVSSNFQLDTRASAPPAPVETPVIVDAPAVPAAEVPQEAKPEIPPFDPTVMTGFFKKVVDTVCAGTTIPPQFVYLAARVYAGAYMAPILKLSGADCDTCSYGVSIGPTGTSKGLSWRRGVEKIFNPELFKGVKVIHSADSGAGIRDAFFDAKCPIVLFIDEMASLANKAEKTKNPEIVDTVIELADTKTVTRVKSKKSEKQAASKSTEARLGFYGCAQTGEVFREAFAGRKKQGVDERFNFEYSDPIEPGPLPDIPVSVLTELQGEFASLTDATRWKNPMTMSPEAEARLMEFWGGLPKEERQKVRFLKNLRRDIYLQAWSRGVPVAELEDVDCVTRHFTRELAIRRKELGEDAPNKVGLYISRLKVIAEDMRERCKKGVPVKAVAVSVRDLQTKTHAFDNNELDPFNRAWNLFGKAHMVCVKFKAANGQFYTKFAPMPQEDEMWDWTDLEQGDWRSS